MDALPALGIDIGSVSVSCALLDASGAVLASGHRAHRGKVRETLEAVVADLAPGRVAGIGITGSGPRLLPAARTVDSLVSLVVACRRLFPSVGSILCVGGERFSLIRFDEAGGYVGTKSNSSCAAGTGQLPRPAGPPARARLEPGAGRRGARQHRRSAPDLDALRRVRPHGPRARAAGRLLARGDLRRAVRGPRPQRGRHAARRRAAARARGLRGRRRRQRGGAPAPRAPVRRSGAGARPFSRAGRGRRRAGPPRGPGGAGGAPRPRSRDRTVRVGGARAAARVLRAAGGGPRRPRARGPRAPVRARGRPVLPAAPGGGRGVPRAAAGTRRRGHPRLARHRRRLDEHQGGARRHGRRAARRTLHPDARPSRHRGPGAAGGRCRPRRGGRQPVAGARRRFDGRGQEVRRQHPRRGPRAGRDLRPRARGRRAGPRRGHDHRDRRPGREVHHPARRPGDLRAHEHGLRGGHRQLPRGAGAPSRRGPRRVRAAGGGRARPARERPVRRVHGARHQRPAEPRLLGGRDPRGLAVRGARELPPEGGPRRGIGLAHLLPGCHRAQPGPRRRLRAGAGQAHLRVPLLPPHRSPWRRALAARPGGGARRGRDGRRGSDAPRPRRPPRSAASTRPWPATCPSAARPAACARTTAGCASRRWRARPWPTGSSAAGTTTRAGT